MISHVAVLVASSTMIIALLLVSQPPVSVSAWSIAGLTLPKTAPTQRSALLLRRGRGSLGREIGGGGDSSDAGATGMGGMGTSQGSTGNQQINWIPIAVSAKALPSENNKVGLIDTNLPTMKNSQINPTGAVSVIKYKDQTYCFAVNCPSCKIPLTKAQAIDGNTESGKQPRLVCDFCKATYNLKTGAKLPSAVPNAGILGGIAKTIFSAKDSGPLPVYKLGEKNGKLVIALD